MSSPTIVKLSVSPRRSSPSTPSNKRRVTPSAEQSSSKHILIVATPNNAPMISQREIRLEPFFAPRQLFPDNVAVIAPDWSHAHPLPQEPEGARHERHVLLPFNLRDLSIDIYEGEVRDLLYQIFPKTINVTEARWRSHLIFQVEELPKSPWPLTVGGVPFTINSINSSGTGGRALIFPRQLLGNLTISICQEGYRVEELSDELLRNLAGEVQAIFNQTLPTLRVLELMITAERTIYVILEDHVDILSLRNRLPGRIASCPAGYINSRELHRPLWTDRSAKRPIEPQPTSGIIDNTAYDILRPGVLICSKTPKEHDQPGTVSTTSGVLVQDRSGNRFMTVSSHGIGDDGKIWQGDRPERTIGEAVTEIPFTNISLVKLHDDTTFVNKTFEYTSGESPTFSRLATSKDKHSYGAICFLNSPYTGNMEASIVSKSAVFEHSPHPTENQPRYVIYNWTYMGQTEGNEDRFCPPDGACGSAIWDDDGVVTGFYHYYIKEGLWKGFAASVSASEVVEGGYTLAEE